MAKTVADEMPDHERRQRLIKGLKATGAETVGLDVSHLAQAVGLEAAEKMVKNLVQLEGAVTTEFSRKARLAAHGLAEVDRLEALKACEEAEKAYQKELEASKDGSQ